MEVTVFHIPKAKCTLEGEDVFWSHQGVSDPNTTLNNHFKINDPLFAYKHARGRCPLTKKVFLDRINMIALLLGEESLKGHGI